MSKSLVLGNGNILVGFDGRGQVRDMYFPYIGLENHVGGFYLHRIGIFTEGKFSWLSDKKWEISINTGKETLSSNIKAFHPELEVELFFNDVVYNEKNIFIRKVIVSNKADRDRAVKIFFHQEFEIAESHEGDTAYFDPEAHSIIHYKGRRAFSIMTRDETGSRFDDYSVGIFGIEGKEGTFRDAEDGVLSKNPIEHGRVDSVVGHTLAISAKSSKIVWYWVSIAETIGELGSLNAYVLEKRPEHLIHSTENFWRAWVNRQNFTFVGLDPKVIDLFKKSLFFIRAHADSGGAILASSDSDMLQHGRDTYNYMWPRDGAISALALDRAGDVNVGRRFFAFCNDVLTKGGYFLHKYRPDKSLGSSWHPWVRDGKSSLPIQEDETALVLCVLWEHYRITKDLEFIESIYNSFIKPMIEFMITYRDEVTKLPLPSYDLWEEKWGVHTFTAASVYGALHAGANLAKLLGKLKHEAVYRQAAEEVKGGILTYLYNPTKNYFYKTARFENGAVSYDETIDMSSIYGIYHFGVLPTDDPRVVASIKTIEEGLCCKTTTDGVPRYEGDRYYRGDQSVSGNPWFVTTMWLADYYIAAAKSEQDLDKVKKWLNWVTRHALPSGVLSEQLDPHTGEQISAAPLTWSHAEFVLAVVNYLNKLEQLGICRACDPVL